MRNEDKHAVITQYSMQSPSRVTREWAAKTLRMARHIYGARNVMRERTAMPDYIPGAIRYYCARDRSGSARIYIVQSDQTGNTTRHEKKQS